MSPVHEFHFLLFCQLMLLLFVAGHGKGYQGECPPSFDCGLLGKISFPFTKTGHQHCGLLTIQNCDDHSAKPKEIQLENNGKWFEVLQVSQFPHVPTTIHMRDKDLYKLLQSKSCAAFYSYTIPATFSFGSFHLKNNSTLYKCNHTLHVNTPKDIYSYANCSGFDLYYGPYITDEPVSSLTACTMIHLPIKDVPDARDPFTFVTANILTEVQLSNECANCHYYKRGECQLDREGKFSCANGSCLYLIFT